ncbi:hypothetical protein [Saccharibacillus sp. JS10]|uniref:hypothetical protein n=1 Tax=Saccharibacillus sp. JS10 TaxID=2950552 RepID=UPI002109D678|nr:hypothetical protein [Saccharibacillus sp. JS10]MCQ4088398.1 hypothetical protein [Saccharibacillus sp. JS10]
MEFNKEKDQLIIEPGIGIGKVKLGMTQSEIEEAVQYYKKNYEAGTNYFDFFEHSFKVEYDANGKAEFIEIVAEFEDFFECTCYGLHVFKTKADQLISALNEISKYSQDVSDEYQYIFGDIGLNLWRPSVFTEETRQEDWFQEMSQENQELEMRYFYFQTAAVHSYEVSRYKDFI